MSLIMKNDQGQDVEVKQVFYGNKELDKVYFKAVGRGDVLVFNKNMYIEFGVGVATGVYRGIYENTFPAGKQSVTLAVSKLRIKVNTSFNIDHVDLKVTFYSPELPYGEYYYRPYYESDSMLFPAGNCLTKEIKNININSGSYIETFTDKRTAGVYDDNWNKTTFYRAKNIIQSVEATIVSNAHGQIVAYPPISFAFPRSYEDVKINVGTGNEEESQINNFIDSVHSFLYPDRYFTTIEEGVTPTEITDPATEKAYVRVNRDNLSLKITMAWDKAIYSPYYFLMAKVYKDTDSNIELLGTVILQSGLGCDMQVCGKFTLPQIASQTSCKFHIVFGTLDDTIVGILSTDKTAEAHFTKTFLFTLHPAPFILYRLKTYTERYEVTHDWYNTTLSVVPYSGQNNSWDFRVSYFFYPNPNNTSNMEHHEDTYTIPTNPAIPAGYSAISNIARSTDFIGSYVDIVYIKYQGEKVGPEPIDDTGINKFHHNEYNSDYRNPEERTSGSDKVYLRYIKVSYSKAGGTADEPHTTIYASLSLSKTKEDEPHIGTDYWIKDSDKDEFLLPLSKTEPYIREDDITNNQTFYYDVIKNNAENISPNLYSPNTIYSIEITDDVAHTLIASYRKEISYKELRLGTSLSFDYDKPADSLISEDAFLENETAFAPLNKEPVDYDNAKYYPVYLKDDGKDFGVINAKVKKTNMFGSAPCEFDITIEEDHLFNENTINFTREFTVKVTIESGETRTYTLDTNHRLISDSINASISFPYFEVSVKDKKTGIEVAYFKSKTFGPAYIYFYKNIMLNEE